MAHWYIPLDKKHVKKNKFIDCFKTIIAPKMIQKSIMATMNMWIILKDVGSFAYNIWDKHVVLC